MQTHKILLTGATGFIGKAINAALISKGFSPVNVVRGENCGLSGPTFITDITGTTDWSLALNDVDVVIHSAGRVHVISDDAVDPLNEYRNQNVESTLHLANSAAEMGVQRFIFISTVKVFGEQSEYGLKFSANSDCVPSDPYGISKMEAEIGLQHIAKITNLEVVIIRVPLVYGPGVKANFLSMINWLQSGIPLPFGGLTKNLRSLVFLTNLVDLIIACVNHPAAANQVFLVSDDEDLSTAELIKRMALALDMHPKLISVPSILIAIGARLAGRADISRRLCGSLQVDIQKTKDLLAWSPPFSVDEGLRQTAVHFLKRQE